MDANIIVTDHGGIVCDNPNCDFKDADASFETFGEYLNKPCPKCGDNLLTQQDYDNAMLVWKSIQWINSLTPDQIKQYNDLLGVETDPSSEGKVRHARVSTHNGIQFDILDEDKANN